MKIDDSDIELLSNEELAMLLGNDPKEHSAPLSPQESAAVDALKYALLARFLIDCDLSSRRGSFRSSGLEFVLLDDKKQNIGAIFFDYVFAGRILNLVLGGSADVYENIMPLTKNAKEILKEVAKEIISAFAPHIMPDFQTLDENPQETSVNYPQALITDMSNIGSFALIKKEDIKTCAVQDKTPDMVLDVPLEMTAQIAAKNIAFSELLNWREGFFFPLGIEKNPQISILCGDSVMLEGKLGRKNQNIAVKITKKVS
ncbi:MAG: FliM/FliN family flagellar motor switch protein [Alphaproteobacteria bacterium]|nr:FliM/FliN family flagellar motor switch protein [Alphaproteobacteria bacterium]